MPAVVDAQTLRQIPLFAGLADDQLEHINAKLRKHSFSTGTNIITFETPGEVIYIIQSGTVKIKVDQADGKEVIIALLGAGEIVGELSVIDNDSRSADVMTQEDSVLFWIDRATFKSLLAEWPVLTNNLLSILTRRVRLSTEQIQALGTLDVLGKVARQLIVFADQYGIQTDEGICVPMRLTQCDIAGLVGASRERVNQVFVNLRSRNSIAVSGTHRVTIIDPQKLRQIIQLR